MNSLIRLRKLDFKCFTIVNVFIDFFCKTSVGVGISLVIGTRQVLVLLPFTILKREKRTAAMMYAAQLWKSF